MLPYFRSVKDRMGTQYLTTTLNHILESAIKEKMPGMCTALEQSARETRAELSKLGYQECELGSEQVYLIKI